MEIGHGVFCVASAMQFCKFYTVGLQPFGIIAAVGKLLFDGVVREDFASLAVHNQNLARLKFSVQFDFVSVNVQCASLRSQNQTVVGGDHIARGAQTVAVEHTASVAAVGEDERCRTVPRLHKNRVILVEGLQVGADGVLLVERFGHHHCHCVRQRHSRTHKELKRIVERRAVAHIGLNNRREVAHIAQRLRRENALTSLHPTAVAADGVDFAVVSQHTERLRQRPRWERVGAEP